MLTVTIQDLARTIEESCSRRVAAAPPLPTGWPAIDQATRGLPRAAIHEWFSDTGLLPGGLGDTARDTGQKPGATWLPPLTPILHLARQAAATSPNPIVWIGRRIWPYPVVCGPELLERSIFIDAADLSERAWATDVSLRCSSIAAVIADGTAFTMSATRRLQLGAAEGGTLGLILRPPHELRQLSAAQTRWLVSPSPHPSPRWTLRLLRSKGTKLPSHTTWTLELNHETGALDLVSDAADRSGSPQEIAGAATA
jgi:hypothetical protein